MRTFQLNKLVRDNIVKDHLERGSSEYRVLDKQEYLEALKNKIIEEAQEFDVSSKTEMLKELADLQEVIDNILATIGETKANLKKAQSSKNKQNGWFKKRHFISTVTLPEGHWLTKYYSANLKRFPEVKNPKRRTDK